MRNDFGKIKITKQIIISIFIVCLLIICIEAVMMIKLGLPPREEDLPNFKYDYVDINNKFFKKVYKENGYMYVPQRLYNAFEHTKEFSAIKSSDTIRIFILGGSVAHEFNHSSFESLLQEVILDKKFEVINCGMDGYDSYRVYLIEKEILKYDPDLIIVLSGNNEFRNKMKINLKAYYLNKFLSNFWVFRKVQNKIVQLFDKKDPQFNRNGEKRIIAYEKNIRNITLSAKKKGVPIILCTLPVNMKDYPPNVPIPICKEFYAGSFFLENDKYSKAIEEFENLLKIKPKNPFGFYYLGHTYERMKNFTKAKEYYLKHLDSSEDDWDFATPRSNEIVRKVCVEEEVGLVDLELSFMDTASYGLLGREQFYDNCHWYSEYYDIVEGQLMLEIYKNDQRYQNINITNFEKLKSFVFLYEFSSLNSYNNDKNMIKRLVSIAVTKIIECDNDHINERAISSLETVYLINPDELWNIQFEKDNNKKEYLEIMRLMKDESNAADGFVEKWPYVLNHIGETYRRLKLYDEALTYFSKVISLKPYYYSPYIGLGLVYYALGNKYKVYENINRAEELSNNVVIKYYKEILGF